MKQQVNLYLALPKRFIVRLPFHSIVNICLILILGLGGISTYTFWQKRGIDSAIKNLESAKTNIALQIVQLKKQYSEKSSNLKLILDVRKLKQEVEMQTYILNTLKDSASKGFSNYFNALSQRVVPNLWLTKIEITDNGEKINLIGKAYSLNLISLFVKNLQKDINFEDKQIKLAKAEQTGNISQTKLIDATHQKAVDFVIVMQERES